MTKEVIEAREVLGKNGYAIENLWQKLDVTDKYKCDDILALKIMNQVLNSGGVMINIHEAVSYECESRGLKEIEY